MKEPREVIAEALGGTYTARGDTVSVLAALRDAGYALVELKDARERGRQKTLDALRDCYGDEFTDSIAGQHTEEAER